jgi:hypothetical protein
LSSFLSADILGESTTKDNKNISASLASLRWEQIDIMDVQTDLTAQVEKIQTARIKEIVMKKFPDSCNMEYF